MRRMTFSSDVFRLSALEIVVVTLVSLVATVALIYPVVYRQGSISQYFSYEQNQPESVYRTYQTVQQNINQSEFVADASVFLFWMLIGMTLYIFVESILRSIRQSKLVAKDLRYKGFSRRAIIEEVIQKFFIQILAGISLYLVLMLSIKYFIPFVVYTLGQSHTLDWYLFLQSAVLFGCFLLLLHICTVLLRLTLLRVRVFLQNPYDD